MVVHGFDIEGNPAMDEISTLGKTKVAFLDEGEIEIRELYPEDFGIQKTDKELIKASSNLDKNKEIAVDVLNGKSTTETEKARLNLCLVNAAAILFLAGVVDSLPDGVQKAMDTIKSGNTLKKLQEFIKSSEKSEKVEIHSK